jgi:hypothetical protein
LEPAVTRLCLSAEAPCSGIASYAENSGLVSNVNQSRAIFNECLQATFAEGGRFAIFASLTGETATRAMQQPPNCEVEK